MPGGDGSMYKTVEEHKERLDTHELTLKVYGQDIDALKKADSEFLKELTDLKKDYVNLENTILKSSQETQSFMKDTMKNQWELINQRDQIKEAEQKRQHELLVGKQGIIASNWSKVWEFTGKLFTVGGVGYLIFEAFFAPK